MVKFDEKEAIRKMTPYLDKVKESFTKKGIKFKEDIKFKNTIFFKANKEYKISYHSLYRFSGISTIHKAGKNENEVIIIDVTDEMYINSIIKPIVENYFKEEEQ